MSQMLEEILSDENIKLELNRRMPNGMYGGVRGGRKFLLLDRKFQKSADKAKIMRYNNIVRGQL